MSDITIDLQKAEAMFREGKVAAALTMLDFLYQDHPDNWMVCMDLAAINLYIARNTEALYFFKRAETLGCPLKDHLNYNSAMAHKQMGDLDKAILHLKNTIEITPTYHEAHVMLGECYILSGYEKEGYALLEHRFESSEKIKNYKKRYSKPEWNGERGVNLLVYNEQGRGDTIQNIRFLPLLQEMGCRVTFECQPELKTLLSNCDGINKLVTRTNAGTDELISAGLGPRVDEMCDYIVSMNSIKSILNAEIKMPEPYIRPQKTQRPSFSYWEQFRDKMKIGICWAGNPTYTLDRHRSLKASYFEQLKIPGVELFSLQYHGGPGGFYHDMSPVIDDMNDTANIIMNMDLVISIDTGAAHLAGALGRPVWMLLSEMPDCRWGLKDLTTPWYPSVTLIRNEGNWATIFDQLQTVLKSTLSKVAQTKR